MLNLHCKNNDKKNIKKKNKKNKRKKVMRLPRFEPGMYGLKVHQGIHYAMEANAVYR